MAGLRGIHTRLRSLRGVVFDMDGTLTVDGAIDFGKMRRRLYDLGLPVGGDVLSIRDWSPERRQKAEDVIEEMEHEGRENMEFMDGLHPLLSFIKSTHLRMGILTRNSEMSASHFLEKLDPSIEFCRVVTRDFEPTKPHPAPLLDICRGWEVQPTHVLMVGDSKDDVHCGVEAGAVTCLIETPKSTDELREKAHLRVHTLHELHDILRGALVPSKKG